nr:Ig-like domain-containing protein [Saprospiraceae bacterium]
MKKIAFFLFAAMLVTFFACRKDVDEVTTDETTYVPPILEQWVQPIRNVNGTLIVFVSNEAGEPVPDAKVKLGNLTLTTDQYGHAFFRDAGLNAEGSFITVENAAYFTGSRRFFPVDGAETRVRVELIAKQFDHSFASQDGGLVELNGGASITFPENSIRKADGTPYNGTVKLAAHWLDPANPRTLDRMPGNLQGINNQGTEVVMATYGMVVAELQDEAGNPINILKGKTATIKMPVPTSLLANAPAEIPLWSYYEDYGVWAEEGKATLQNGAYVGEVSHFSFWNCDYPYPLVDFTATFVDENGNPLVNYWVTLTPTSGWAGTGYTDSNGTTSGKVPKDETFTLEVLDQCGNAIFTLPVGPFTADVDLGQVVVTNSALNTTTLTGQLVDCNNQPILNGIAIFQFDGQTVYEYTTTGSFDISFSTCSSSDVVIITGVDMDEL